MANLSIIENRIHNYRVRIGRLQAQIMQGVKVQECCDHITKLEQEIQNCKQIIQVNS